VRRVGGLPELASGCGPIVSLTTDLSRISGSFVIGRHTAFTYKGRAVDLKQIGRELNIRSPCHASSAQTGGRSSIRTVFCRTHTAIKRVHHALSAEVPGSI
jgi:hypothetical protein